MKKTAYALLFSFIALCLASCSSSDNTEKPAALVEFTPKVKVEKVWSTSVQGADDDYLNLNIGHEGNTLYTAGHNGKVYAVDAATGNTLWKKQLYVKINSGVSVANHLVLVGTSGGSLIALNAKTGHLLWQVSVNNQILGLAAISKNTIVVKTVADTVMALNTSNGDVKWQYSGDAPQLILRGGSQPKISGNAVVVGFANGKVGKFNLSNGTLLWMQSIASPTGSFAVQRMIDITASPIISNGIIYATTYQGNIAALELSTGQVVWNHKLSSYTGIALQGSNVYVTDAQSHVWKFQQDNGGVSWRQKALQARIISAPALLNNAVIVGDSEGYIHWLQMSNGQFIAREKLSSDAIRTAPIVIGNTVYVLNVDGELAAYRIIK